MIPGNQNTQLLTEKKTTPLRVQSLDTHYGKTRVLQDITLEFPANSITTIVGPSGAGKSTLLRSLNRINDENGNARTKGTIRYHGTDINTFDLCSLRKKIGMIFQKPTVFPQSILENVVFGITEKLTKQEKLQIAKKHLRQVALYEEVKDRLDDPAAHLSVGQKQRLCIARTLALTPEILLMDEPTSSLDPVSTLMIESLIKELKKEYAIILVTHDIEQAKRISDHTVFMCEGKVIEQGSDLFRNPLCSQTKDYISFDQCRC